tara:strand:- start:1623 stop:1838 length:216 start_codon:yes stop_codon:yes gene_type:complete
MSKYKISILWGEEPEIGQKAITYTFNTQAELNAFNLGISEMDGWMGFDDTVEEGYVSKRSFGKVIPYLGQE